MFDGTGTAGSGIGEGYEKRKRNVGSVGENDMSLLGRDIRSWRDEKRFLDRADIRIRGMSGGIAGLRGDQAGLLNYEIEEKFPLP